MRARLASFPSFPLRFDRGRETVAELSLPASGLWYAQVGDGAQVQAPLFRGLPVGEHDAHVVDALAGGKADHLVGPGGDGAVGQPVAAPRVQPGGAGIDLVDHAAAPVHQPERRIVGGGLVARTGREGDIFQRAGVQRPPLVRLAVGVDDLDVIDAVAVRRQADRIGLARGNAVVAQAVPPPIRHAGGGCIDLVDGAAGPVHQVERGVVLLRIGRPCQGES